MLPANQARREVSAVPVTEHTTNTNRHTTFYLATGPESGPLVIFIHGWPELSISWRHQLPALAALGFRAIAPDMRGYGRSSVYSRHGDYAQEHIVRDMLDLIDSMGRKRAVWVDTTGAAQWCGISPAIIRSDAMPWRASASRITR
jgi:alpha-beta hydrolase superfamily lysophospholipase